MIKVPVSLAVVVFLLVTVAFLLALWILSDRRSGKSVLRETRDHVLKCPICTHVYLETRPGELSRCPECGSMNTEDEAEKVDLSRRRKKRRRKA